MILEILGLLAISLLLGNAYLYFYSNSNGHKYNGYEAGQAEEWERSILKLQEKDSEFEKRILAQEEKVSRQISDLSNSLASVQAKTEDSIKRIEKLESIVVGGTANSESGSLLAHKLARLEDFRRNATIELEAIKELFPELKKKKAVTPDPELEQKIHSLLFRGKSSK
ncbi:MAG: hypothetical protein QXK06_04300 [Candidatus Diapherotrites archaeon]